MELGYSTINKLHKHMQDIVQCYSFKQIFQIYKNISKQIIIFMRIFKVAIQKCQGIKQKLEECVKLIYSLVNSVQYPKYGHRLPLLAYIARKYQKQFKTKVQENPKLTHQRILLNQKQEQIQLCCSSPFQWKYLAQLNYNQQFKSIASGQIKLHDAQCVCCSQVFVKGMQITKKNTRYPVLVGLTQKENSDMNLQRYICAVCNAGGGVILVGVDKKINSLWPSGIKHKDQQHLQQNINKIYASLSSIQPQFYSTVQKIVVQSNFLQKNLIEKEFMRFCFRITIYPLDLTQKYYLQIVNKGYNSIYQVYQLDSFNKPEKIVAKKRDQGIFTLYSLVTDYYNCNKNKYNQLKTNNHYTFCRRPLMQYSKLFHQSCINKQAVTQQDGHKESAEKGFQQQIQPKVQDQPSFKYSYSSLLTVGSKKKEKFIKEFSNYLKSKKMLHSLEKPFPNSFKDGPRPLWLLSHHDQLNIIKSLLKQFDKSEHITLIPVYKTLQIDRVRLTAQKQQILRQKFYSKYPEGYQIQELPQQNNIFGMTNPIFVSFNSYFHAIFGYMIFESLQLRPYFVKQNTTYKKKPKIKSA